jgi:putative inner membrane protein
MGKIEKSKANIQKIDKELLDSNPTLQNIDPQLRQELIQTIISVTTVSKVHSGPLPDVETLNGYNRIIPNGAERLMQQVEKQSQHRRDIENKVVSWNNIESLLGQLFGLIIAGSVLYASYSLAINGHETVASILGGATIVGLTSIFVYGKKKQGEKFTKQ